MYKADGGVIFPNPAGGLGRQVLAIDQDAAARMGSRFASDASTGVDLWRKVRVARAPPFVCFETDRLSAPSGRASARATHPAAAPTMLA